MKELIFIVFMLLFQDNQQPSYALLNVGYNDKVVCGSSFVQYENVRYIVTALHCLPYTKHLITNTGEKVDLSIAFANQNLDILILNDTSTGNYDHIDLSKTSNSVHGKFYSSCTEGGNIKLIQKAINRKIKPLGLHVKDQQVVLSLLPSCSGDSGSLIVDNKFNPIGIVSTLAYPDKINGKFYSSIVGVSEAKDFMYMLK